MSDPLSDLNLILTPDWLKDSNDKNPYANYEGESQSRGYRGDRPRRNGPGGSGGPRSGGSHGGRDSQRSRPDGRGGPRGSQDRPGGGQGANGPQGQGRGPRNQQGPRDQRAPQGGRDSRDGNRRPARGPRPAGAGRDQQRETAAPQQPAQPAVPLQVDFLAEVEGIGALTRQIKSAPKAYPLYSLGRMFLNKPERHRVKISTLAPACPIFRIGEDGPITLNRQHAERDAFRALRATYYSEETQQIDAPKGNFANVARCRISGVLLGPTNYHGYQPALRRLYDTRFSRRSSYEQFLRQIEVVNDPAVVEQWKTESSSVTVFRTLKEEEPLEFKTLQEVEAHFRENYQAKEVHALQSVEVDGVASRNLNDRTLREAIREAWEKERAFPAQLANQIRPHFTEAGLQIWKHRKRVLFVSTVRPVRVSSEGTGLSESVTAILGAIGTVPRCTRADLSAKLLTPTEDEAEAQKAKAALAADLHWLISSGHVIEFHDATLDLPLPPKEAPAKETPASSEEAAVAEAEETVAEVDASETVAAAPEPVEAEVVAEAEPIADAGEVPASLEGEAVIEEAPQSEEAVETAPEAEQPPQA